MVPLLRGFGALIFLLGMLTLADHFEFVRAPDVLVVWTRHWGMNAAWIVRFGLVALGAALFFGAPTGSRDRRY